MGTRSKRNRKSKSGTVTAEKRGQAGLSGQLDAELGFADRDMRAKCAEIAASLPVKPTDIVSIIRDAQKLFDWITTGKLQKFSLAERRGDDRATFRQGRRHRPLPRRATEDGVTADARRNHARHRCRADRAPCAGRRRRDLTFQRSHRSSESGALPLLPRIPDISLRCAARPLTCSPMRGGWR